MRWRAALNADIFERTYIRRNTSSDLFSYGYVFPLDAYVPNYKIYEKKKSREKNSMANQFKKQAKRIGRHAWELFKSSILSSLMYVCAGMVIMMLTMKEDIVWKGSTLAWSIVGIVVAAAYQGLASWANGGTQYEMLVSGNVKRSTYDAYGNEYKMSNHKEAKEYRPWKGFVVGGIVGLMPVIFGIILGCNQETIDAAAKSGEGVGRGLGITLLLSFILSGWSILPFYCMNAVGVASVSYFVTVLFAIIPVAVSGGLYIAGAYARRNKAIRMQILAEKAAAAEAERRANKKINYGGLPGTKPKKKK